MSKISQYIESLIFVADSPITEKDIKDSLQSSLKLKTSKDEISETIAKLQKKYKHPNFSFELIALSDGYQFMTKADYHDLVGQYLRIQSKKKLSRAAMETLAIIAYKQPMTKSGIESIRGVNCDYAILKLVEKELVEILGRSQSPGRPILYGTSDKFMDYFGIRDITDLPKLKEIIVSENSIGMEAGLQKMHNEGLTEEYQFHPEPEPINEEVDLSEVSVAIETTEVAVDPSTEKEETVEEPTAKKTEESSEEQAAEQPEASAEEQAAEKPEASLEEQAETSTVEQATEQSEVSAEEQATEKPEVSAEVEQSTEQPEVSAEVEVNSQVVAEDKASPEVQNPVETIDSENLNEESRNEEEGEGVNSEEN